MTWPEAFTIAVGMISFVALWLGMIWLTSR